MSQTRHTLTVNFEADPSVVAVADDQQPLPEWILDFDGIAIHVHQRQLLSIILQVLPEFVQVSDDDLEALRAAMEED